MKDTDILISENKYLEQINEKLMFDNEKMKRFLQDLRHPEAYGHAVTTEVRQIAARILQELQL
jgi:hypothetical protein